MQEVQKNGMNEEGAKSNIIMKTLNQLKNSIIIKKRYARKYAIQYCKILGKKDKFTNIQIGLFLYKIGEFTKKPNPRNVSNQILDFYEKLTIDQRNKIKLELIRGKK